MIIKRAFINALYTETLSFYIVIPILSYYLLKR